MSSPRHQDHKRPGAKLSSKALGRLGLFTPDQIALWARRHGLLSVYLRQVPIRGVYPACWQVVWPGHRTDASGPAWHAGHKSFAYSDSSDRQFAERRARAWASAHFNADTWVRIEGIGGALFPDVVGDVLQTVDPEVIIARNRAKLS